MLFLKELAFRNSGPLNHCAKALARLFPRKKVVQSSRLKESRYLSEWTLNKFLNILFLKSSGEGRSRWNAALLKNSFTTCLTEA